MRHQYQRTHANPFTYFNMIVNKAVIPIAGLGTRFLPVTKVIPKEMLPIKGKPILQILIEEVYKARIKEVILVINKEKEKLIKEYFSKETLISKKISRKGKDENLSNLNKLISDIKFSYVFQKEPLGDGHAILQAENLVGNEPFAVLFGDDIIIPRKDEPASLSQLIKIFEKTNSSVIALEKVPKKKISSYGVVQLTRLVDHANHANISDHMDLTANSTTPSNRIDLVSPTSRTSNKNPLLHQISDLVEKPSPNKAPSNLGIIGKYIVTPKIFEALKKSNKSNDGEIRLIDGFKELIKTQKIYGLEIRGKRYDTGTLEGYKKAILEIN